MPFGPELFLGFVMLFLVMFFVIIPFVIARVGGWAALAAEYRLSGKFEGKRWRFQDVTLRGWFGYNGGVSVGANAEGLYLNTFFFVSHPPLFIPWTDLSVTCHEVKFLGFRVGMVEFAAARVPDVHIELKESLLKKIAATRAGTSTAAIAATLDSPWNSSSDATNAPPETPQCSP